MQEKRKVPFIGDKHKTSRLEGLYFNLLDGLAYDLEAMAPGARHEKRERGSSPFPNFSCNIPYL
jgi:hypothetical protein